MYKLSFKLIVLFLAHQLSCASIDAYKPSLEESITPLMWAAASGHLAKVKDELIKCGVNFDRLDNLSLKTLRKINKQDDHGRTALFWAVQENKPQVVDLLLKVKSNQLKYDDDRMTPLSMAVENSNDEIVKILFLDNNLDLNSRSELIEQFDLKIWYTPLMRAVKSKNPNPLIVKHLLLNGGELDTQVKNLTVRNEIIKGNNREIIEVVEKFKRTQSFPKLADEQNSIELFKQGIFFDEIGPDGGTAFHRTSCFGNPSLIDLFIKSGVDVNIKARDGSTPLFAACRQSIRDLDPLFLPDAILLPCLSTIELLIKNGADVNRKDNYGNGILHFWAECHVRKEMQYCNQMFFQLLVNSKADVNIENRENEIPLHLALALKWHCNSPRRYKDIISLLINSKTDVNKTNKNNLRPLQILRAAVCDASLDEEIAEMLIKAGAR